MANTTIQSQDRNLFGTIVRQSTNGMFCVTDFQKMYETTRVKKGWSNKPFQDIFSNKKSAEQLYYTLFTAKLIDSPFNEFMKLVDKDGLLTVLKNFGLYQMKGRAENRLIWANPYIFVYICMQMNPEIYGTIVTWLTDKLIFNRLEASQNWRPMTDKVKELLCLEKEDYIPYQKIASTINVKVFGKSELGIRNFANEKDLKTILEIEKSIEVIIRSKFVKTLPEIINFINEY